MEDVPVIKEEGLLELECLNPTPIPVFLLKRNLIILLLNQLSLLNN